MRQNKICCKWHDQEFWHMTYIRPWVIVKSLGQRIILRLSSPLQKLDLFKQVVLSISKLSAKRDQFRWQAALLMRSRALSFLISSYALLQTKTACGFQLKKTGTGENFFPPSLFLHQCIFVSRLSKKLAKRTKEPLSESGTHSLVDYYHHVPTIMFFGSLSLFYFFVFYVLVFVFFPPT